ncbi:MAG: prolipoprotein diacylglyceryl transferase [Verrucomicrobiota bacterium]
MLILAETYWHFEPKPILFELWGGFSIRYYSLAYLLGFFALYWGLIKFHAWKWSSLNKDQVADFVAWMVAGVLIGGRLGYCLLYDLETTLANPISVIDFWSHGGIQGMASHGGFLGVVGAIFLYAKRHGHSFWQLLDNLVVIAPIGLFLGRIANFINGELWGRPTDLPWAVVFLNDPLREPRHASQLYQALGEGFLLFFVIFWLRRKSLKPGVTSLSFLAIYSSVRFFVEFFREKDSQFNAPNAPAFYEYISQGQILSVIGFISALVLGFLVIHKNK